MDIVASESLLISYIRAANSARQLLSQFKGLDITAIEIQLALADVLKLKGNPPLGLLEKGLDDAGIVELLSAYDFSKWHPEVLAEFVLDDPIVPLGIPKILTEKTVKVKGEVWRVHKSDPDSFPSIPHAHNYDSGVVLHLGTGEMFSTNKHSVGKIGCKKLLAIRDKLTGITLPETSCK